METMWLWAPPTPCVISGAQDEVYTHPRTHGHGHRANQSCLDQRRVQGTARVRHRADWKKRDGELTKDDLIDPELPLLRAVFLGLLWDFIHSTMAY